MDNVDRRRKGARSGDPCFRRTGGATAIVIGVQSRTADFSETERYARHAEKLGADAVVCIAPPGVTAASQLLPFYQQLGKVTSLPLFAQTGGDFQHRFDCRNVRYHSYLSLRER